MTAPEVRALVTAYYQVRELPKKELPDYAHKQLLDFLADSERDCIPACKNSEPGRWACSVVGPVLAAGLGAATYMRDVPTATSALRMFGLTGDRPLSSQAAWKIIQPYVWEPVISAGALEEIRRLSRMRLRDLVDPSPVDVLVALTRHRSVDFAVKMAHWLGEYFRNTSGPARDDKYASLFRLSVADLRCLNDRGEMMAVTGTDVAIGKFTREEWEGLIKGRLPESRLEYRAGLMTTRQFLVDYWEAWQDKPAKIPA